MSRLTAALALLSALSTPALAAEVERPVTSFAGEREDLLEKAKPIVGLSPSELRSAYLAERKGKYGRRRGYEAAVEAAIGLWQATTDGRYRDLAKSACLAMLGDLAREPAQALCTRITERGSLDPNNFDMRNACYHFALLYCATGQDEWASRSAAMLARFAAVIPQWPIFRDKKVFPQSAVGKLNSGSPRGFWGAWMFLDIHNGLPLLYAYDLVYHSGAMQRAGQLGAIESMLHRHVDLQLGFGWKMFNCEPYQIDGMLIFAKYLGQPEWFHLCAKRVKDLYKVGFCADGWWLEGTPSYHKQTHYGLKGILSRRLQGYSDPPGFVSKLDATRFDDLDLAKTLARPMARADSVLFRLQQPNRVWQTVHDTTFPHRAYGVPEIAEAKSYLFGCTGHAILGYGKSKPDMVQATLHFSGTHGHEHRDMLNLILWAKSHELICETRYRTLDVENTTREWHNLTAGHVTVVVDGTDNTTRWSKDGVKRKCQPTDAIPGVPDWYWRWRCYGDNMNNGKLRLFNTDFEQVQVVEADGERAYGTRVPMALYRRTIALVKINQADCYVVDVFRVKGGTVHDYMLHSCLNKPHHVKLSLPLSQTRPGVLHKYIHSLREGNTDRGWTATFSLDDERVALKTFLLPQAGATVILGQAPAMRRNGEAPFLAVRHTGGESTYVAVHHPYTGEPLVKGVEPVALADESAGAVALRVTLPDRVDTIVATFEDEPGPTHRAADGSLLMRGRFAHVAAPSEGAGWAYLVGGGLLKSGRHRIEGSRFYSGTLVRTCRVEAGDPFDAFVTPGALPTDGSLDGHTLMVDIGDVLVQGFRIERVERRGGETLIFSADEPGMTITPGLVKLEYFPCWGITGDARFRIAGTALSRE